MADPANTKLGRMLLDEITPVVMVLRTPLVEESCRKNGLSLIEMLTPYSNFNNIDVPVRTASDQPYRLRKFKLRLFYDSKFGSPILRRELSHWKNDIMFLSVGALDMWKWAAKERLKQVITRKGDKDFSGQCSDPPDIESLVATSQQEFVPSWFQNFNKELVDAVSFSEHEAFDHPVACLVAVSSKDKDPIGKFVDLFNTNQLPSLLNDGAMDPKILKATGVLTAMRSTFGANDCRLLCINSSADGMEEHQENPWASYKNSASNSKQLGCFLNVDDIEELRNTMHDLSSKHIIPHMELKIRVLNQQVSATRKGFRNQIKNLWWRKGKDDAPENPNGPMYTFSSTESQIRVLGDYAFMLRDYELALSNYRLISTDYKLDKAWKHYAGVQAVFDLGFDCFSQEMMGLAYFMLDQSRKDAEYCMENAFTTYLNGGYQYSVLYNNKANAIKLQKIEIKHQTPSMLRDALDLKHTARNESISKASSTSFSFLSTSVLIMLMYNEGGDNRESLYVFLQHYLLIGKTIFNFRKLGHLAGGTSTRCGIWWAEMLKARGQFKDAAGVYFRISGEQASYCFLSSTPTMLRKYGFHLVLSGDLYKKSDQIKHAIRTYRGALSVFKGLPGTISGIMWYAFLGMFDEAIKHILEVLARGHQSKATQELFLWDFFRIVQETGKTFEVFRLQLPVINFPSIKIVFEDHRTYASPSAEFVFEIVTASLLVLLKLTGGWRCSDIGGG
ncbi:hypothetical protein DH2020_018178 [Rehmannia glutinosa]|uniref:Trafficking protein particle complex subunit 8-like protein n=1 Tax=Rehmannia glutinosa TaxID=99300 RepID=A0ABR0WK49_REHGL